MLGTLTSFVCKTLPLSVLTFFPFKGWNSRRIFFFSRTYSHFTDTYILIKFEVSSIELNLFFREEVYHKEILCLLIYSLFLPKVCPLLFNGYKEEEHCMVLRFVSELLLSVIHFLNWHLFLLYAASVECWRKSHIWPTLENIMHNVEGFDEIFVQIWQHLSQDLLINFAVVSWSICKKRNVHLWQVLQQAKAVFHAWQQHQIRAPTRLFFLATRK